jgi:hypothetical protein
MALLSEWRALDFKLASQQMQLIVATLANPFAIAGAD